MNAAAYISGAAIVAAAVAMAAVMVPAYRQHRREMREPVLIFDRDMGMYLTIGGMTAFEADAARFTNHSAAKICEKHLQMEIRRDGWPAL